MEKITTDISSFENLRKGGYVYVDKTDLLWRLVADKEGRQFFISRPRRFGKSLMLSTLKCIFEGKRELFKGLKIEKRRYDWKKYPVVHLDMTEVSGETPDELKASLFDIVDGLVKSFEIGMNYCNKEIIGIILCNNSYEKGAVNGKPALEECRKLGASIK